MTSTFAIWLTKEAQLKMSALADECNHEVSGLFTVRIDGDGDIAVDEVACLPQWGGGADTHLDMQSFMDFITTDIQTQLEEKGAEAAVGENIQTKWLGWFHSHPGSGTAPSYSSTDNNTILELAEIAEDGVNPFFCGIVLDSSGKHMKGYVALRKPFKVLLTCDVKVLNDPDENKAREWAKAELKEKIRSRPLPPATREKKDSGASAGHGAMASFSPLTGRPEVSGHFRWFEGIRYLFDDKVGLWTPSPTIAEEGSFTNVRPKVVVPYMGPDAERRYRAVLVRSESVPKVKRGAKLTKIEQGVRNALHRRAGPGEPFLVDEAAWNVCNHGCNHLTWLFDKANLDVGKGLCLGCERLETNCSCAARSGITKFRAEDQVAPILQAVRKHIAKERPAQQSAMDELAEVGMGW